MVCDIGILWYECGVKVARDDVVAMCGMVFERRMRILVGEGRPGLFF
jgi:hypothetical protein